MPHPARRLRKGGKVAPADQERTRFWISFPWGTPSKAKLSSTGPPADCARFGADNTWMPANLINLNGFHRDSSPRVATKTYAQTATYIATNRVGPKPQSHAMTSAMAIVVATQTSTGIDLSMVPSLDWAPYRHKSLRSNARVRRCKRLVCRLLHVVENNAPDCCKCNSHEACNHKRFHGSLLSRMVPRAEGTPGRLSLVLASNHSAATTRAFPRSISLASHKL